MNMSYCKFRNTLNDLRQCQDDWDYAETEDEKKAKKQLIELMVDLLSNYEEYQVLTLEEYDDLL